MIDIKTPAEMELMREAGSIVHKVHDKMRDIIRPGISTKELDEIAEEIIRGEGAEPAFKGYHGFPATICASINNEIVHGIPSDDRILKDGDIIGIDVGSRKNGFYGDGARTYAVGDIDASAKKLMEVCESSLAAGIEKAVINNRIADISAAVQDVAESFGYSVVREYVGHGIGRHLHEDPQVPNFVNGIRKGPVISAGMAIAIEPMINIGSYETVLLDDEWTVVTKDNSLSAHFEHTIFITEEGPVILT